MKVLFLLLPFVGLWIFHEVNEYLERKKRDKEYLDHWRDGNGY